MRGDATRDLHSRHACGRMLGESSEAVLEFVERVVHLSVSFNWRRPRCSDDLTVPSDVPIASAISAVFICR